MKQYVSVGLFPGQLCSAISTYQSLLHPPNSKPLLQTRRGRGDQRDVRGRGRKAAIFEQLVDRNSQFGRSSSINFFLGSLVHFIKCTPFSKLDIYWHLTFQQVFVITKNFGSVFSLKRIAYKFQLIFLKWAAQRSRDRVGQSGWGVLRHTVRFQGEDKQLLHDSKTFKLFYCH